MEENNEKTLSIIELNEHQLKIIEIKTEIILYFLKFKYPLKIIFFILLCFIILCSSIKNEISDSNKNKIIDFDNNKTYDYNENKTLDSYENITFDYDKFETIKSNKNDKSDLKKDDELEENYGDLDIENIIDTPQFYKEGKKTFLTKETINKFNKYMDICNKGILTDKKKYKLNKNPKISVIISIYNGGKYLKYSLR